jgi:hypothetical protein
MVGGTPIGTTQQGGGDSSSQTSVQSFGSIGSNSQATAATGVPVSANSFLGWGSSQGSEPGSSPGVGGWGTPQSKPGGAWN